MAKKPVSKSPPRPASSGFRGFINYTLTEDDKATIKRIEFDSDDVLSWLDKVIDSGFKLTFSYDDYSHANMCVGTRQDKEHEDFGILLSGRGSTPAKAFRQWLYLKDSIIGDATWTSFLVSATAADIDD